MSTKILWVDTETTGLMPWIHDIHQLSGMIEIDGNVVEEFDFRLQPLNIDAVQQGALDVSGVDFDTICCYPHPSRVFGDFTSMLSKYVKRTDKNDKFIFAGHNAPFDYEFVRHLFKKLGQTGFNQYLHYKVLDTYGLAFMINYKFPFACENLKLETLSSYFNIPHTPHEAMSDIRATRELFYHLLDFVQMPIK